MKIQNDSTCYLLVHTCRYTHTSTRTQRAMDGLSEMVGVWVSGDGGDWSCGPSQHFRVPTTAFEYYMTVGRLNTCEDLLALAQESAGSDSTEWTDIYVAYDGNWSGSPPLHLLIPVDVFDFLLKDEKNTARTIGSLTSEIDVSRLVDATRQEMETEAKQSGAALIKCGKCSRWIDDVIDDVINDTCRFCSSMVEGAKAIILSRTELKECGHRCTTSIAHEGCCSCLDRRPTESSNAYPAYVDGEGWSNSASRGAGYCPHCRF